MLTLIAAHTYDTNKHHRVSRILKFLQPEMIAVSSTEKRFWDTIQNAAELTNPNCLDQAVSAIMHKFPQGNKETVKQLLYATCAEANAITDYIERKNTLLLYCGKETQSEKRSAEESFWLKESYAQLKELSSMDLQALKTKVQREYLKEQYTILNEEKIRQNEEQDEHVKNRLLSNHINNKHLCYFGSLEQIFGEYTNLFNKVKQLKPVGVKLNIADELIIKKPTSFLNEKGLLHRYTGS